MANSNRRRFLKGVLAGAAGASLPLPMVGSARARPADAGPANPTLAVTRLADDMVVIAGAGGNVLAARDAAGLLLVDGGMKQYSEALLERAAGELSARHVHTLFNTHWHPEQTGSNERLGKAGATIVAHENTRLWLKSQSPLPEYTAAHPVAAAREGGPEGKEPTLYGPLAPEAQPQETFYDKGTRSFGNEQVEYGYLLQAHTDGDLYVFFPERNVLVAGGALAGEGWPIVDWRTGGWIGGLVNGLRTLIELSDEQTRIVPANGPVLTRADLEEQRDLYGAIFGRLQKMLRSGFGPADAVEAAPAREFEAKYGDSRLFVTVAFQSLWGHMSPDA